jgi:acyl-CoA thioesterase I
MRARSVVAGVLLFALGPGCTAATRDASSERVVYVAIGASDTVGVGAEDPRGDAWPAVFRRIALPPQAEYHNLGISGATTEQAIREELPEAVELRPTIATVWLNVNDLTHAVLPTVYEDRLRHLLTALRRAGADEILVANTPMLDELPAYRACLSPGPELPCPFPGFVPPPALVRFAVEAYNEAIEHAAQAADATVVDLHAIGQVPVDHPAWISDDGFHPSTRGYREVAERFAQVLAETDGR